MYFRYFYLRFKTQHANWQWWTYCVKVTSALSVVHWRSYDVTRRTQMKWWRHQSETCAGVVTLHRFYCAFIKENISNFGSVVGSPRCSFQENALYSWNNPAIFRIICFIKLFKLCNRYNILFDENFIWWHKATWQRQNVSYFCEEEKVDFSVFTKLQSYHL